MVAMRCSHFTPTPVGKPVGPAPAAAQVHKEGGLRDDNKKGLQEESKRSWHIAATGSSPVARGGATKQRRESTCMSAHPSLCPSVYARLTACPKGVPPCRQDEPRVCHHADRKSPGCATMQTG